MNEIKFIFCFGVAMDIVMKLGLHSLPFTYATLVQFSMIKELAQI